MPAILRRLTNQIQAQGKSKDKAYPIAVAALQKNGILKRGSTEQLTPLGAKRNSMTAGERAKDRAAKYSKKNRKPSEYSYNKKTNRATLIKRRNVS